MRRTFVLLLVPVFAGLACNFEGQDPDSPRQAARVQVVSTTAQSAPADEDAAVRAALKKRISRVEFNNLDFSSVIEFVRGAGVNIDVRWEDLRTDSVEKTTMVSLYLNDVSYQTLLEKALAAPGGNSSRLDYAIENGGITISTHEAFSKRALTRVYDVRDLASAEPMSSRAGEDAFELSEPLMYIIKSSVDKTSWMPEGPVGMISVHEGMLVVTQTALNHREIENVLASLREARFQKWERELTQKLAQTVVKVDFQNARFAQAVDAVRSACGVNIVLAPGVSAKTPPFTLKASDITLQQALNLIVRMEGLSWTLTDGTIYISAPPGALPAPKSSKAEKQEPAQASAEPAFTKAALEAKADELKNTVVTAQLDQEIPRDTNVLWCASFQLAWNELMDYAGGPLEIKGGPAMVGALNKRAFDKRDIDDAGLVAVAGLLGDGVLDDAANELKRKFPGFVPRLLSAGGLPPDAAVMYACLIKQLPFEFPFTRNSMAFDPKSDDVQAAPVSSFGLRGFTTRDLAATAAAGQARVLWHRFGKGKDPQQFVVELVTRAKDDRLILAMIPPKRTLADTIDDVTRLMAEPNTLVLKKLSRAEDPLAVEPETISKFACLLPTETLDVPVLDFDILREFRELYGMPVSAKNPKVNGQPFVIARQTIRFKLNETGARLESEGMGGMYGESPVKERDFTFNRPFLVMLMRKASDKPYFAAWIANEELLMHEQPATQPTSSPVQTDK